MKSLFDYINEEKIQPNGFCILKPGFDDYYENWFDKLTNHYGWKILKQKKIKMTKDQAAELYKPHKDKDFFNDLCDYMSSDYCWCCSCYKDCEDPIENMSKLKYYIRDEWGKSEMKNVMHSSDSLDNVRRESKICLDY